MGIEWLALLTPVLLAGLATLIFGKKLLWPEIVAPIIISIIIIMVMKWQMEDSLTVDTEYRSAHVVNLTHEDEWNEYIHKRCSYTTYSGSGKNRRSHTHYYDCSYVRTHPEQWYAVLNTGSTFSVSPEYYQKYVKSFGNEQFVEMNRHYHTIDGDAHSTYWPNTFNNLVVFDYEDTYENRAQAAETLFHFYDLDSIKKKGLYEYPAIVDNKQSALLTPKGYSTAINNKRNDLILRRVNGLFGKDKQIKVFVLVFKGQSVEIAERQRIYWKGGNKNELVVCVDADYKWAKAFSWCDNKQLETSMSHVFADNTTNMQKKLVVLKNAIPANWKRKSFEDFSYIDVPLHTNQLIWIHTITLLISIGMLWWGVVNEFEQEESNHQTRHRVSKKNSAW